MSDTVNTVRNIQVFKHYSYINFTNGSSLAITMDDDMQPNDVKTMQRRVNRRLLQELAWQLGCDLHIEIGAEMESNP